MSNFLQFIQCHLSHTFSLYILVQFKCPPFQALKLAQVEKCTALAMSTPSSLFKRRFSKKTLWASLKGACNGWRVFLVAKRLARGKLSRDLNPCSMTFRQWELWFSLWLWNGALSFSILHWQLSSGSEVGNTVLSWLPPCNLWHHPKWLTKREIRGRR